MTAKLLLAALFIAIATAATSNVDEVLATSNVDEVLPEDTFEDTFVQAEVQGQAPGGCASCSKCTLRKSDPECGAPSIYTEGKLCKAKRKKDCQYKKRNTNGSWSTVTRCSKWNKRGVTKGEWTTGCSKWAGSYNNRVRANGQSHKWPFCHELTSADPSQKCRCAGKNENWGGAGKPCFAGPNPKETKVCRSKKRTLKLFKNLDGSAITLPKCEMKKYKQGPWTPAEKLAASCNDSGYAKSSTCSYPKGVTRPKPKKKAKKCVCKVRGYKKSWKLTIGKKSHHQFSWFKKGQGGNTKAFNSIECTGCLLVQLHDNDHRKRHIQNAVLHCCNGCKYVANTKHKGGFDGKKKANTWDLHNDVSAIDMLTKWKHNGKNHQC
jgi:hypothetical protein